MTGKTAPRVAEGRKWSFSVIGCPALRGHQVQPWSEAEWWELVKAAALAQAAYKTNQPQAPIKTVGGSRKHGGNGRLHYGNAGTRNEVLALPCVPVGGCCKNGSNGRLHYGKGVAAVPTPLPCAAAAPITAKARPAMVG